MATAAELWDDPALINAFDEAMSKYKAMHSKGNYESSNEGSKVINSTKETSSSLVEEVHKAKSRPLEEVDYRNVASDFARDIGESTDPSSIQGNPCIESCVPQCHTDVSDSPNIEDAVNAYSNAHSNEDYTQLLNQYYGLEEKRQQIIWQLHQFGYGTYQHSAENSGAILQCDAQDYQVPVNQVSNSMVVCSCNSNSSHCTAAPSTSLPACSLAGACGNASTDVLLENGPENTFSFKNDDNFTTAMEAAKRAISSLKMNNSERGNDGEQHESQMAGDTSSEADLTDVLSAWFSAGFITARYLMEQSAKKGHG